MEEIKIAASKLDSIEFIPESLIKNAKLVYRKGDIIQKKGLFKKEKRADHTVWDFGPFMHDIIVNEENSFYIEHDGKLYYKSTVRIYIANNSETFKFDSEDEALSFYYKLIKDFDLKEVRKL